MRSLGVARQDQPAHQDRTQGQHGQDGTEGAGAVARNHMGLVIFWGVSIGTLFTLFVVPAMYLLLARDHSKQAQKAEAKAHHSETPMPIEQHPSV